MTDKLPRNYTGKAGSVFYIDGTPSKRIVEQCEGLGLVKFPSQEWRNYALGAGARPYGLTDALPDEVEPTP